ncbi:hypothetical protein L6164_031482 [Bauhinia variegata]|uniref:Uncharacterized protein n=1 Tax=Bauhinia variegata TaxID=167791 RepID=A0ACB9LGC1_BAUVA|nr:hypothetical protein L6164_031482 [Bauhinia variegata]
MPENRQVQKNAGSNQSGDNIEDSILRLKINDNRDRDAAAQSTPFPDRPGEPDCLYYLRTGSCGYGSNCRYNHPAHVSLGALYGEDLPERIGQPDCGYFLKTGTCKYGSTCKYHHPRDRRGASPVSFNVLGLPMRQEEKSCPYYMRNGACKFGVACKFNHPQPASVEAAPVTGSPASAIIPSSGLPYVGGLPAWSLPRMPYLSGQGLQSYVPAFLPTSQGYAQGWNGYMGNMNPAVSANFLGSNLLYHSMNLGEPISGGQVNLFSTMPALPERPDQPECRYFMSTGTCKFGSDCKFHHPKERVAQSVINPLGLPMRPGQAICTSYKVYGICKYGPTCKFDHPFMAIPQNYSLHLPPMPLLGESITCNPRSLSRPSETSQSKSSKLPDWVPKSDSSSDKTQSADTKATEDSSNQADAASNTVPASLESVQD